MMMLMTFTARSSLSKSKSKIRLAGLGLVTAAAMLLAACAPTAVEPSAQPTNEPARTGVIQVVASTNVWGSIAQLIGGDLVEVTSIVDDPTVDPHSYEATARDQLAVSEAELIIANGGGYDSFMDQLVGARQSDQYIFLKVVEGEHIHGDEAHGDEAHEDEHGEDEAHEDEHGEDEHGHEENEHVWFDLDKVRDFAADYAAALSELRPESLDTISANFDNFMKELETTEVRIEALRERALQQGATALETAPLAGLLLEAAGFELLTPESFIDAIEEEREIPATAIAEVLELIASGQVSILVTNRQLLDSQVSQIQSAAEAAGIPVVQLSELILDTASDDYLSFMDAAIDALMEAIY
jgi:zinc/manganese transport system substrate-binding protein